MSEIQRPIRYQRQGRYFLSQQPSGKEQYLCFVLHGYGQLPQYFIRHFQALKRTDILFVAPEGLHRFYLEGSQGRVGSSWMTKEERLADIADYIALLEAVASEILAEQSFRKCAVLGFSQGVATAARWLSASRFSWQALVLYAGAFPPDLNWEQATERLPQMDLYLRLGDRDPYAKPERLAAQEEDLVARGLRVDSALFSGAHQIYPEVIKGLFVQIFPLRDPFR